MGDEIKGAAVKYIDVEDEKQLYQLIKKQMDVVYKGFNNYFRAETEAYGYSVDIVNALEEMESLDQSYGGKIYKQDMQPEASEIKEAMLGLFPNDAEYAQFLDQLSGMYDRMNNKLKAVKKRTGSKMINGMDTAEEDLDGEY